MPQETALITGASSGLGEEFARLFAADRANLVLVARRVENLRKLAEELTQKFGVIVRVLPKDLAVPGAAQEIFDELARDNLHVDVLVNNAGFGDRGDFAEIPVDRQTAMIQVNLLALTQLTRLFLPGMLARGRGGVLNVASSAAFQPGPTMAVYFATKAFILSLSEAVAFEVRRSPVRVTCLCPGPTVTEFGAAADMERTVLFRVVGTMTAASVARAGYRGLRAGRVVVEPGLLNKLMTFLVRLSARGVVRWFTRQLLMDVRP